MNRFRESLVTVKLAGLAGVIALFAPTLSHAQNDAPPFVTYQVDRSVPQPFQASWGIPFDFSANDGKISVPAGKRLVIEYVSLTVSIDSDCHMGSLSVQTRAGETLTTQYAPIEIHTEFGTRSVAKLGQLVRFRADPGTDVFVNYSIAGTGCNPIGALAVSGYFESVVELP
jgi:hypothetical protein